MPHGTFAFSTIFRATWYYVSLHRAEMYVSNEAVNVYSNAGTQF